MKNEKRIAVLGGGAIAKAIAGDCALAGNHVRICDLMPFAQKTLFRILENGIKVHGTQINLMGFERSGVGRVEMVTTDVAEAVKGADIIIVATSVAGHKPFFEELIPNIEDGMVIHIIPDNFGALILRKMMRNTGCKKNVIIGGWAGPPFDSRVDVLGGITMPSVKLGYRATLARGAALPFSDQEDFIQSTRYIGAFDSIHAGDGVQETDTILDVCLSNVNPLIHTVGLLMGASVLENFTTMLGQKIEDFSIYSHAFCPTISKVQYAFYCEQRAIAEAIGVNMAQYDKEQFFSRESVVSTKYMGPDFRIPFDQVNPIAWGTGPTSVNSRYLTEDIPVGTRVFHLLGERCGIKTPVMDSMMTLASVVIGKDYYQEGFGLDTIDVADLNNEELLRYVKTGKR